MNGGEEKDLKGEGKAEEGSKGQEDREDRGKRQSGGSYYPEIIFVSPMK